MNTVYNTRGTQVTILLHACVAQISRQEGFCTPEGIHTSVHNALKFWSWCLTYRWSKDRQEAELEHRSLMVSEHTTYFASRAN